MNFDVCSSSNTFILYLLLMINVYNKLMLCKTLIARELTWCKILVRHLSLRKLWSTSLPIEKRGSIPYLTRGLQAVSRVDGVHSCGKIITNYSRKLF